MNRQQFELLFFVFIFGASQSFTSFTHFPRRMSNTGLHLFGFVDQVESLLFDSLSPSTSDANKSDGADGDDDVRKELYMFLALEESEEIDLARQSLMNFLQLWCRKLEDDPKGLATPILGKDFHEYNASDSARIADNETMMMSGLVESMKASTVIGPSHSMKLIFRPPKRYLSYKEQRDMEKGVLPDRKGAKVDAWSPGGVELVLHTTKGSRAGQRQLHLQVLRCDIDGDTVIKYSSERAIVRRLQEAIRIWKRVREMK